MSLKLESLALDARDPARLAQFWAVLLGRHVAHDAGGELLVGTGSQLGLRFVQGRGAKAGRDRVHLHLTSTDLNDQQRIVEAALGLGASHLDVGQLPEEGHIVLADPEGNELCVIEPGNGFLAGCGVFGELACDGTRDVGLFWAQALNWPLVWDHDGETAIQSQQGGTKVAWGGPPVAPATGRNRQQFHLATAKEDQQVEVDRLRSLGATLVETPHPGAVIMADPDGIGFRLTLRA